MFKRWPRSRVKSLRNGRWRTLIPGLRAPVESHALMRSLIAGPGADIFRSNFQSHRLSLTIHFSQEFNVVLQHIGHIRMYGPKRFLPNRQGAFEEGLGLGVPALRFVEVCQIVEFCGGIRMIGAEDLLTDGQGAFI